MKSYIESGHKSLRALAANSGFSNLTKAEIEFLRTAPTQERAICGPTEDLDNLQNDPRSRLNWPPDRCIRAGLIRWLCVDEAAKVRVDPSGIAILGAAIIGDIMFSYVKVDFPLIFFNCRIPGAINFEDAHLVRLQFEGSAVSSISAAGITVERDLSLRRQFYASDELDFTGAQIGGNLDCDESEMAKALAAEGALVSGSVFLRKMTSRGLFKLINSSIGGSLECDGGNFQSPPRTAAGRIDNSIDVNGSLVKGDVYLRRGFVSEGDVGLAGVQIGGDLDCTRARIIGELDARRAVIKGAIIWMEIVKPEGAILNLRDASTTVFRDDYSSWPSKSNLWPEGFVYQREVQRPSNKGNRIEWLSRIDPFQPQPYKQMAKVKKESGDDNAALKILVELERRQRAQDGFAHPGSEILNWTIGYGYYPLRALWAFAGLTTLSWIIYRRANLAQSITPTDKDAYESYKRDRTLPPHYKRFSPFVFSLENSLPLVKLGQVERWQPDPSPGVEPLGKLPRPHGKGLARLASLAGLILGRIAKYSRSPVAIQRYLWIQIIVGWILATLFAAGIAGMIHKD